MFRESRPQRTGAVSRIEETDRLDQPDYVVTNLITTPHIDKDVTHTTVVDKVSF